MSGHGVPVVACGRADLCCRRMSRPPRLALPLAALLLIAAVCGATGPALAGDCVEVISGDNAQKLFDALKNARPDDGCTLEAVRTEVSRMTVVWTKGGTLQDGILVAPTSCVQVPTTRGVVLSTIVPPSTATACPAASEALSAVVRGDTFGGLRTVVPAATVVDDLIAPPPPLYVRFGPAALEALAGALAAVLLLALWKGWSRGGGARARALAAAMGRRVREIGSAARAKARGLWSRMIRPTPRGLARAGWGAAILLGPHLLLGTWLLVVPDHLAFTAAQVVTLAHVGLAVLTFPLAGVWILWHIRGMRGSRLQGSAGGRLVRWLLTAAAIVAAVTGLLALRAGDLASTAVVHAACGVAVGVPLALHLWLSARRWPAIAAAGLLLASTVGAAAARRWLPPASVAAEVPAFAYETRAASLYEPASNCAECHVEDYQDWSRSVHARTLQMKNVQESLSRASDLLGENLTHIGQILATRDSDRPVSAALIFGACGSCHAPSSFYGDGNPSLLRPEGVVAEGTGCSFCHTLREVRQSTAAPSPFDARPAPAGRSGPSVAGASGSSPSGSARPQPGELSRADIFATMARAPLFVSAPETVRRYLGQGSSSPLARQIANWLIRWRPQVHARDYHSPVLDDSRACLPCHSLGMDSPDVPHMTYYGWEHSSFNTGDPKTTVECQDCHMARHATGQQVNEWARMVPWGPSRPHARSHLFLGGNVAAARTLGDAELATQEHELNAGAASVAVARVAREGSAVTVTVTVRSEHIGHYFPALETNLRYGWVQLQALDAAGNELAHTPRPRDSEDYGCASPLIMASVTDPKPDNQRLIAAGASRELVGRLTVPAGATIDRIVAELHDVIDPQPLATATWSARGAGEVLR